MKLRYGGRDTSDIVDRIIQSRSADPLLLSALREVLRLRDELASSIREAGQLRIMLTDSLPIEFVVEGAAAPQGSKRAFVRRGRAILVESCKRLKPWREAVSTAAGFAWRLPPTSHSVIVTIRASYARPKSHLTRSGAVRKSAPAFPRRPDADKLCRGILDALTGVVVEDDSQVTRLICSKAWGDRDECWITICQDLTVATR